MCRWAIFKLINISSIYHIFISNSKKLRQWVFETKSIRCMYYIDHVIVCRHHYRYRCLRSDRNSNRCISQIYITKNPKILELTSPHRSGKDIQLVSSVVAYQVKWCDASLASSFADRATRILHFAHKFAYHTTIWYLSAFLWHAHLSPILTQSFITYLQTILNHL